MVADSDPPYVVRYGLTPVTVRSVAIGTAFVAAGVAFSSDEPFGAISIIFGLLIVAATILPGLLRHLAIEVDADGIRHMHPVYRNLTQVPWDYLVALTLDRRSPAVGPSFPVVDLVYQDDVITDPVATSAAWRAGRPRCPAGMHLLNVPGMYCRLDEDELRAAIKAHAPRDIPVEGTLRR